MIDWGAVIGVIMFIALISVVSVFVIDSRVSGSLASDEAMTYCRDMGYDNYKEFNRVPFTTKALGIKCEYVSRYDLKDSDLIIRE